MDSGLNVLTLGAVPKEPVEVDPRKALLDMRLRSHRELLEGHLRRIGVSIVDDRVEDLYDINLKREFSQAVTDDWEIVFLEVPRWMLSDGDKARDLDAVRHGFRRKTVRFVSPNLDLPCPAVRRVFQVWKDREGIDAQLIPWSDINYLKEQQTTLAEVLRVDRIPSGSSVPGKQPAVDPGVTKRDRVFISYSHANPEFFRALEIQLAGLRDKLDVWSDERIEPGADWFPKIQKELDRARVAILLVTPEFVASEFIRTHEVPKILEAAGQGDLTMFWIHFSDCHFDQVGLNSKQAAHDVSKPLDLFERPHLNRALKEITKKVLDVFEAD